MRRGDLKFNGKRSPHFLEKWQDSSINGGVHKTISYIPSRPTVCRYWMQTRQVSRNHDRRYCQCHSKEFYDYFTSDSLGKSRSRECDVVLVFDSIAPSGRRISRSCNSKFSHVKCSILRTASLIWKCPYFFVATVYIRAIALKYAWVSTWNQIVRVAFLMDF